MKDTARRNLFRSYVSASSPSSRESIAALQPSKNCTSEFPSMRAQAFLTLLAGRGFVTVNPW